MSRRSDLVLFDPLYGELTLSPALAALLSTPAVQRLRQIRLSNIDSVSMPGIANVSRFEHAIGSAHVASRLRLARRLATSDFLLLQAAALLHDIGISAFGHLVEEALSYVSVPFNHELKLARLLSGAGYEVGGIDLQIFLGRQSGLRPWADAVFRADADERLTELVGMLVGSGRLGPCINGAIDVDNLDNLVRIAFHMGLDVARRLPLDIASGILDSAPTGLIFTTQSIPHLESWLQLRYHVYGRLMLSRRDFVGKTMLLFAVVKAYQAGELGLSEYVWTLTDRDLLHSLQNSQQPDVRSATESWLLNRLWPLSDLFWMDGEAPSYHDVYIFGSDLSSLLQRPCFAYRILDKRVRLLELKTETGGDIRLGSHPRRWLLGISSPKRIAFSSRDNATIQHAASEAFRARFLGPAEPWHSDRHVSTVQLATDP